MQYPERDDLTVRSRLTHRVAVSFVSVLLCPMGSTVHEVHGARPSSSTAREARAHGPHVSKGGCVMREEVRNRDALAIESVRLCLEDSMRPDALPEEYSRALELAEERLDECAMWLAQARLMEDAS